MVFDEVLLEIDCGLFWLADEFDGHGEDVEAELAVERSARGFFFCLGGRFGSGGGFAGVVECGPGGEQRGGIGAGGAAHGDDERGEGIDESLEAIVDFIVHFALPNAASGWETLRELRRGVAELGEDLGVDFMNGRRQCAAERILGLFGGFAQAEFGNVVCGGSAQSGDDGGGGA